MTKEELKNTNDLDLQVRELNIKSGKTLVGANGVKLMIKEVEPHLDVFRGFVGEKKVSFSLRQIVAQLLAGNFNIID